MKKRMTILLFMHLILNQISFTLALGVFSNNKYLFLNRVREHKNTYYLIFLRLVFLKINSLINFDIHKYLSMQLIL